MMDGETDAIDNSKDRPRKNNECALCILTALYKAIGNLWNQQKISCP